jgi:hypothetical protein
VREPYSKATTKIDQIHAAGVERHAGRWFAANLKASHATIGYGLTDKQLKELVPLIVLRVLDVVCPAPAAGGPGGG